MTRDEILLTKVKELVGATFKGEITTLKRKLKKMESLKDNWRETALRREAEIKELKERLRDRF